MAEQSFRLTLSDGKLCAVYGTPSVVVPLVDVSIDGTTHVVTFEVKGKGGTSMFKATTIASGEGDTTLTTPEVYLPMSMGEGGVELTPWSAVMEQFGQVVQAAQNSVQKPSTIHNGGLLTMATDGSVTSSSMTILNLEQQVANVQDVANFAQSANIGAQSARDAASDYQNAAAASASSAQGYSVTAANAKSAAESARDLASGYKDAAITSAETALGYRNSAQQASSDASGYSSSASGYSSSASGYATDASGYASTASTAKDDAVTAKDAAVSAQSASESARDLSVAAKDAAVAARDAALVAQELCEIANPPQSLVRTIFSSHDCDNARLFDYGTAGNKLFSMGTEYDDMHGLWAVTCRAFSQRVASSATSNEGMQYFERCIVLAIKAGSSYFEVIGSVDKVHVNKGDLDKDGNALVLEGPFVAVMQHYDSESRAVFDVRCGTAGAPVGVNGSGSQISAVTLYGATPANTNAPAFRLYYTLEKNTETGDVTLNVYTYLSETYGLVSSCEATEEQWTTGSVLSAQNSSGIYGSATVNYTADLPMASIASQYFTIYMHDWYGEWSIRKFHSISVNY